MLKVRVMSWRDIPSQVKVTAGDGTSVSRMLPPFFQQEIDRVAMVEGIMESDDYLELWTWSEPIDREGEPNAVAEAVADEVAAAWRSEHEARSS